MGHSSYDLTASDRRAWNAGKEVGTKRSLKPRQIWAIRFFLDRERRLRDRALFDLAIDSKLRGCDLVKIKIGNLDVAQEIRIRTMIIQQKTGRPVQFELMSDARSSLLAWLQRRGGTVDDYAFPSRIHPRAHMSTRQYARLVDEWVEGDRASTPGIRYSFPASHQGFDYLQSDGKSASHPDLARSYENREPSSLSRSRCRGCSRTCRGN